MARKYNDMHILKLLEQSTLKEIAKWAKEADEIEEILNNFAKDRRECMKFLRKYGKHCRLDQNHFKKSHEDLYLRVATLRNSIALKQVSLNFIRNKRRLKRKKKVA